MKMKVKLKVAWTKVNDALALMKSSASFYRVASGLCTRVLSAIVSLFPEVGKGNSLVELSPNSCSNMDSKGVLVGAHGEFPLAKPRPSTLQTAEETDPHAFRLFGRQMSGRMSDCSHHPRCIPAHALHETYI